MQHSADKLTGKKARALTALLSCRTVEQAAEQAKVNPATIFRWLNEDLFRSAYAEARCQIVEVALAQVQRSCGKAALSLELVLDDVQSSPSAKVAAAKIILETSVKIIELIQLEDRLARLEERLPEK
jgi:hypothetical protein